MKAVDARIEPLLAHLDSDRSVPRNSAAAIRQAIAESPFLTGLIANAAVDGQIGRVAVSQGQNNGGHFEAGKKGEPGTIYVSESIFRDWKDEPLLNVLTEILGHEAMHGVLTRNREQALEEFSIGYRSAMESAYQDREPGVNVTAQVRAYLDFGRKDEALSEISGLRALNSRIKHLHPSASSEDVEMRLVDYSKSRCVEGFPADVRFAQGITYESINDASKGGTALTKAVEQCYFDGPATLGKHGDSDYRNYYGVGVIEQIGRDYAFLAEGRQPPEIRVDLRELGLDPRQLERNGLDLGVGKMLPLVDMGKDGLGWVQLKHTAEPRSMVQPALNRVSDDSETAHASKLSSADSTLLEQIREKVGELDKLNGRRFDETSERISASLLATAKEAGMTRADHVVLSVKTQSSPAAHTVFVVQGDLGNPASVRAHLPTAEAAQRSVQESFGQVESINQRQAQEQVNERQQDQERQHRVTAPSL